MAVHRLKEYQVESLEVIARFGAAVRQAVNANAARPVHDAFYGVTQREFIQVPQMPNVPYVCLRVPTGGGKTLIGAHAVGTLAKHLGHEDRPLCLWVTPSTTVRDQTIRGLKDREHPYHAALRESLGVPLAVMTMEEALYASKAMMSSHAVIVVTTIQSYRIDKTDNRKVYEDNGYLMEHFRDIPPSVKEDLIAKANKDGRLELSLANMMALRGPIVVMDEAHNARTRISFDSLARFEPLAVLELTATPQQTSNPDKDLFASNVLHAVSALQLKREGMVKLPVELESRDNWLDVLALTVTRRGDLEQQARKWELTSGRYIRPIALIQAQPTRKSKETHTVDDVRTALIDRLKVPAEQVRVATGKEDDLGDEDLSSPDSQVRYVITVEKLREGWDCPFAYVLGSVGSVATETAVEQLLGRVLRMPQAKPTGVAELDRAYAIVQSQDILKTAENLTDSMVKYCGFDRDTVADTLRVHREAQPLPRLAISTIPISGPTVTTRIPSELLSKVTYDEDSHTLHVKETLTREETVALRDSMETLSDRAAVETHWKDQRAVGSVEKPLDSYAEPLKVPCMVVRDGARSYMFEPLELDEFDWNLDQCDVGISEAEFKAQVLVGSHVELGVTEQGAVRVGGVKQVMARQLLFANDDDNWTKEELVRWLDNQIHMGGALAGLPKAQSQAWLMRVVDALLKDQQAQIAVLVRKRHALVNVITKRIAARGREQMQQAAQMLIDGRTPRKLETTIDIPMLLKETDYSPYRRYQGTLSFMKHAFDLIGDMGSEESHCAKRLDDHPNVKRWVRNMEQESNGGFHLPLSPGKFFPDFIAELNDGRVAIVEYKGPHLANDPKEMHKHVIGKLWQERSTGQCEFIWVVDKNWAALEEGLKAKG